MDSLLSTLFPNSKTISPMAMSKPTVENVPSGNYLNRVLNFAQAPDHSVSKNPDYATTLPPSPKNHLTNNPTCTKCRKFPNRPFKRDKCYMLYSPQQNIWGPVCGDGGYNANWVRGNRFGVDYQYQNVFDRQKYDISVPRFTKKNPIMVSDSPYYPFADYPLRFDPKYKSYPYENNFTPFSVGDKEYSQEVLDNSNFYPKGKPTYMYPYATLDKPTETVVEGYENMTNINKIVLIVMICFVLLLLLNMVMKK